MDTHIQLRIFTEFPEQFIADNPVPIFCKAEYAEFLKRMYSQNVIYFAGLKEDSVICLAPLCIIKKAIFRKGTFLTSVISFSELSESIEREFLELIIEHIKAYKICDWIQQPSNWALFRTVPSNSIFCKFGTYKIELKNQNKNEILQGMYRDHKQHIKHAMADPDKFIKRGPELVDDCIKVFSKSDAGKNVNLATKEEIEKLLEILPNNILIYVAYCNKAPQSCVIYFLDSENIYAVYAGMVPKSKSGINHLLHWQAIIDAKSMGIKYYDFVGCRINPAKGSKQEGLKHFKSHFGGKFVEGYLWKMPISKTNHYICFYLTRLISLLKTGKISEDIIDQELKRKQG